MSEEFYITINAYMRRHKRLCLAVCRAEKIISFLTFLSYPLFLVWCLRYHESDVLKVVLVPFGGFVMVTVARRVINAKRPYERFALTPLIKKETVGRSFPSRHVFSIFMLAETYLYATTDAFALPFYAAGLVLAAFRVVLGVHHIADVVVGFLVALFCGVLYYI